MRAVTRGGTRDNRGIGMADKFFENQGEAAKLKHALLRKYLPPFISKVGSTARGGRVTIVDGFAGPGRYADGSEGSPLILRGLAAAPPGGGTRKVDVVLVESMRNHHEPLCAVLNEVPTPGVRPPILGSMNDHIDEIIEIADGQPLFAFLDPYGLDVAWSDVLVKDHNELKQVHQHGLSRETLPLPAEAVDLQLHDVTGLQVGEAAGHGHPLGGPRVDHVARLQHEVLAEVVNKFSDAEDHVPG